jgi:2-polyprenyl-6-methoxyphenol hydroxylase-like FAD-dependent oxidoreductase
VSESIAIVGAGIGGLTAALSLHQVGLRVRIFESASAIQPLGVGINLLPHAVRELEELGLRGELERAGVCCGELGYYTKRGEPIWSELRGRAAGYRWPQISIHRGVLQRVLLEAVHERLGADCVVLGHHLERFEADASGVHARFVERESGAARAKLHARLLVAADGIHSAARRQLYPDEGAPCWNGAILWRGIAHAAPLFDGRTMIMAGHTRQKFVCYPIEERGSAATQPLNFVAELRGDARELRERQDWSRPGKLDDFLPAFAGWRFAWLDVPALIRAAPETWVYPMVDRDPLPRWSFGPVTLLGDAAHPMYPIGSNGASQAILDARVLAGCLRHCAGDLERGLERYAELRAPATAAIVLANRGQGPEAVMQLVEDRAPDGFARLSDVIASEELCAIAERYKQLAGFSVAELNARPSLLESSA